jgi:hypothetical protein
MGSQQSVAGGPRVLSTTSSQSERGQPSLAEAFQAMFIRFLLLGL